MDIYISIVPHSQSELSWLFIVMRRDAKVDDSPKNGHWNIIIIILSNKQQKGIIKLNYQYAEYWICWADLCFTNVMGIMRYNNAQKPLPANTVGTVLTRSFALVNI
jgi:hypothetical protein